MEAREEQGYVVFDMDGYVTKDSVPSIIEKIAPQFQTGKEYVIDMWEVKTMNSSMVSLIVHVIKQLTNSKSVLHLVNVAPTVLNALETVHLTNLVRVHESAIDFEMTTGVEISSLMH